MSNPLWLKEYLFFTRSIKQDAKESNLEELRALSLEIRDAARIPEDTWNSIMKVSGALYLSALTFAVITFLYSAVAWSVPWIGIRLSLLSLFFAFGISKSIDLKLKHEFKKDYDN